MKSVENSGFHPHLEIANATVFVLIYNLYHEYNQIVQIMS